MNCVSNGIKERHEEAEIAPLLCTVKGMVPKTIPINTKTTHSALTNAKNKSNKSK